MWHTVVPSHMTLYFKIIRLFHPIPKNLGASPSVSNLRSSCNHTEYIYAYCCFVFIYIVAMSPVIFGHCCLWFLNLNQNEDGNGNASQGLVSHLNTYSLALNTKSGLVGQTHKPRSMDLFAVGQSVWFPCWKPLAQDAEINAGQGTHWAFSPLGQSFLLLANGTACMTFTAAFYFSLDVLITWENVIKPLFSWEQSYPSFSAVPGSSSDIPPENLQPSSYLSSHTQQHTAAT